MKGMRRNKHESAVRDTSKDRERIAADVERFLAAGGRIREFGHGDTELINGIRPNLLSGHLGELKSLR